MHRATDLFRVALDMQGIRFKDVLAAVAVACSVLAMQAGLIAGAISLVDWIQGRPHTVIPAILALLDVLDGVRR